MATHSSILARRIPSTEELGGLQSMGRKESDTTQRLHFTLSFKESSSNLLICSFQIGYTIFTFRENFWYQCQKKKYMYVYIVLEVLH